jgi:hypothetical protein
MFAPVRNLRGGGGIVLDIMHHALFNARVLDDGPHEAGPVKTLRRT